ncbi:MAG TPA: hypothetical protein VLA34_09330, partial [Candidatus Krumholzibacterium sp.]|nr:hypothetical protein [Candidatus Krumholzibacterium sp.]
GIQAATHNGRVSINLAPWNESRHEKVNVSVDGLSTGCRVAYDSPMRDWFLFGYGETDLGYSQFTGTGDVNRSFERHHDGLFAEGKFSLFGQGEIASGHLMTLAVDSRPVREDILLGRIEPEKNYPVYGDASELRYNSASRSGTYINLENRRYNAMFGDFRTELSNMEFTRYDRTINGLRGEYRHDRGKVRSFLTRTDQSTYQEEMRADGTSGFYFLQRYPLIENSEKIRIEVRDRYRPEQIVRVDYKQIYRDYDINYLDGSILFKEPVASVDEGLNPVWIIVSYECRSEGEINFLYGIRSTFEVADSLEAGATVIIEEEGVENSSIIGVDLSGRLFEGVSLGAEYAHSDKFLLGGGSAFRTALSGVHSNGIKWNTYYRDIDENFFNPSFSGGKRELGSRKLGADLDWGLSTRHSIVSRIFRHDFIERDEKKRYLDVRGVYRDGPLSASLGFAGARRSARSEGQQTAVMLLGSGSFEKGRTRGELQIDQKVSGEEVEEYPNRIQAALSQRLWRHLSGTLRHEYRSGRRSGARHMTQIGVESDVNEDLSVYSRYRMEGSVGGER